MLGRFLEEHAPDGATVARAGQLARKAWEQRAVLDEKLAAAAKNWSLDRMQPVDRSLLRLGAYELLQDKKLPAAVAIDEAVEIAKEFGGADSPGFVNGILDALRQEAGEGRDLAGGNEAKG